jgi:hypothetical protein
VIEQLQQQNKPPDDVLLLEALGSGPVLQVRDEMPTTSMIVLIASWVHFPKNCAVATSEVDRCTEARNEHPTKCAAEESKKSTIA